jgi:hypothetical protein
MGCFLFVGVLSGSRNKAAGNDDGAELMRGCKQRRRMRGSWTKRRRKSGEKTAQELGEGEGVFSKERVECAEAEYGR